MHARLLTSGALLGALLPMLATAQDTASSTSTTTTTTSSSDTSSSYTASGLVGTTGTPEYCTADATGTRTDLGGTTVVPPLPCDGYYDYQAGFCCRSLNVLGPGGTTLTSCTGTALSWSMPLAYCVAANTLWNGCPGNSANGTCCAGPGIGTTQIGTSAPFIQCDQGTAVPVSVATTTASTTTTTTGSAASTRSTGTSTSTSSTANAAATRMGGDSVVNLVVAAVMVVAL